MRVFILLAPNNLHSAAPNNSKANEQGSKVYFMAPHNLNLPENLVKFCLKRSNIHIRSGDDFFVPGRQATATTVACLIQELLNIFPVTRHFEK